jgi:hypothetical protein
MNDKPGVRPEGCYQHRVKGTWVRCTCGKYQQPRNGDTLTGTPEPRNVCPAPGGSNHHERAHQGADSPITRMSNHRRPIMERYTTSVTTYYPAQARGFVAHCGCGWSSHQAYPTREAANTAADTHTITTHHSARSA